MIKYVEYEIKSFSVMNNLLVRFIILLTRKCLSETELDAPWIRVVHFLLRIKLRKVKINFQE